MAIARRYRNYMLVLLGMILIYVESTYVNNYLINIVVSLGGDIKRMGTLLTVSAMSELPTMLLFSRLVGKWDSRKLIRFAAVMFSVKALGYLVCGSISFLSVFKICHLSVSPISESAIFPAHTGSVESLPESHPGSAHLTPQQNKPFFPCPHGTAA
jgi:MFS transporter, PPP family, 3-phenylpropionic acid transporter